MKGTATNQAGVRRRFFCLALAMLVGWTAVDLPYSAALAQVDSNRTSVANDNYEVGPDGRPADLRRHQESFLNWMIRASGIFGFLLMLVAFAMVAIILMIASQLRRDNYLPATFIAEFEQQLQAKDYQGAYESAKASHSFIGRIVAAGMSRLGPSVSYEDAIEQMQQVGDDETMTMEHKIGYLALIGSIAPMLGLLGTMQGIAFSFYALANTSTLPKPSELADGVATAIVTTLEGLVVAIPAIVFCALYRNRLARFLMECGFVAENLMKNFKGITHTSTTTRTFGASTMGEVPSSMH